MLAALPSSALASKTQESTFQDDPLLVYAPAEQQIATLDTLKSFGVDRIRVSVFWKLLAPANGEPQKPNFDATDPAGYQTLVWDRYDTLIREAQARGILVNLNFTSPVPRWASTESPRADLQETFNPNPEEFGQFVRAVGTRYSGNYNGLPRVDYWSIWNEPNQAGWLTPQWSPDPRNAKSQIDAAPSIYRNLVASAWRALADTGHGTGSDTILIGETAPQGQGNAKAIAQSIDALKFVRRLYCVDNNLNVLKGAAGVAAQLPAATSATFVAQNPALFQATGYAHHPYALLIAARAGAQKNPDHVSMADLRDLSRELTRIYQRYGQKTQSKRGVPLYLTEFGYQTAPDPITQRLLQPAGGVDQRGRVHRLQATPTCARSTSSCSSTTGRSPVSTRRRTRASPGARSRAGCSSLAGKRKPSYKAYMTPIFVKQHARPARRARPASGACCARPRRPRACGPASSSAFAAASAGGRARRSPSAARATTSRRASRCRPPATCGSRWRHGSRTLTSRAANVTATR